MFNPCYPFTTELLEAMLRKEVVHFVRSTYNRGWDKRDETIKEVLLMSHYHTAKEAERHFNVIRNDPHRFLYDARNAEQLAKLRIDASQPEGYKVFSKIIEPGKEQKATILFKENTKRYLYKNTQWDLRGRITIYPRLYFQLGELYTRISHDGDEITVKFEDIENA